MEWEDLSVLLDPDPPAPFILPWLADWPDPDSFLRVGIRRRAPAWRHGTYMALVDRAGQAMDQTQRMGLYARAEEGLTLESSGISPEDPDVEPG